ncbi:hypothetical protein AAG906_035590 [Vitis piasezkii]
MPARQPTSFIAMVAYFLNPRFQYKPRFGSDLELLQVVHEVFARLDPVVEALGQFANEVENDEVAEKDYLDLLNILTKVVHSESFNKDTEDSFQVVINSQPSVDSTNENHGSRRVGPYIGAIEKSYRERG